MTAHAPRVVDADHPWLGLRSFTEETQRFFFGRNAEIGELFVRVREHNVSVLYGQSGLGKTSLLGAGLVPKLRVEGFRPRLLRLGFQKSDLPLLDQVRSGFAAACATEEISSAAWLDRWREAETLWELLHHTALRPTNLAVEPVVLIFDQFEEIFTRPQEDARRLEIEPFFQQIADLVEHRPPAPVQARLVVDRRLGDLLDFTPPPLRIVITLREDFLFHLDAWKKPMPSLMRNRMALLRLNGRQAFEAVDGPAHIEGRDLVTADVAEQIVRLVARSSADTPLVDIQAVPPLLSLVCDELNHASIDGRITSNQVGDQTGEILRTFYLRSFDDLPPSVRCYVEDRMVTVGGHRNPVAREDAEAELNRARVPDPLSALDALIDRRLLSAEEHGGVQRLEITHDLLLSEIRKSREKRRVEEAQSTADSRRQRTEKTEHLIQFLLTNLHEHLQGSAPPSLVQGLLDSVREYYAALSDEEKETPEALRNLAELFHRTGLACLASQDSEELKAAVSNLRRAREFWVRSGVTDADKGYNATKSALAKAEGEIQRRQREEQDRVRSQLRDSDQFDFYVSYARKDNAEGWITAFVRELLAEHRKFSGGRELTCFFDKQEIRGLDDWQFRSQYALARSRLLLSFISPAYLASEYCRREWREWMNLEAAKHVLGSGTAPIFIVDVPGIFSGTGQYEAFPGLTRRQFIDCRPFFSHGPESVQSPDFRRSLVMLVQDVDERAKRVRQAAQSETTVPPYNKKFTGRLDELLALRDRLKDDRAGVISAVHGLGGIGKTELAFSYAHAFASAYPGGRFLVPCEGKTSLRDAALGLGDVFRDRIRDEERKTPETWFAAITACLRERLDRLGHTLLVLDNVTDPALLTAQQIDCLAAIGPKLHLLATTRLAPSSTAKGNWLTLCELSEADALDLLERHRPFESTKEREAAQSIVRQLGGFPLAVELVGGYVSAHPESNYTSLSEVFRTQGSEALEDLALDEATELRRHNHDRQVEVVLSSMLAGLSPAERRTIEYAALLPPDVVVIPWLRVLVGRDFPELAAPPRLGHPDLWMGLVTRLMRLALFSRADGDTAEPRLLRVHHLVQAFVRQNWSESERENLHQVLLELIRNRDSALEDLTQLTQIRWELEALEALALHWADTNDPESSWLLNQVAQRWCILAEWDRAEKSARKALAIVETKLGPDRPEVAAVLSNLAQLLEDTNRLADAEPLMRRALAIDEQSFGPEHPKVGIRLNNLAQLLQATNRLAEAEPLMRRVLAIDEQSFGPEHPNAARGLNNLAQLLQATNRLAEAEPLMRRALAIDEQGFGREHPNVARDLNNLASLLRDTNRLVEAEPLLRRALAIDEQIFGSNHPDVAENLNNLAQLLQATNRMAEAAPLVRRALAIWEQSLGENHPQVASALNNLAQLLQATDRLSEAEPLLRRALAIDEQSFGPEHPNVARDLTSLASLMQSTNRLADAEPLLRRALVIYERSFGGNHPNVAKNLWNLAHLLQATNRAAEAENLMRLVVQIVANFTRTTGHSHQYLQTAVNDYVGLLHAMGRSPEQILATLWEVAPEMVPQ